MRESPLLAADLALSAPPRSSRPEKRTHAHHTRGDSHAARRTRPGASARCSCSCGLTESTVGTEGEAARERNEGNRPDRSVVHLNNHRYLTRSVRCPPHLWIARYRQADFGASSHPCSIAFLLAPAGLKRGVASGCVRLVSSIFLLVFVVRSQWSLACSARSRNRATRLAELPRTLAPGSVLTRRQPIDRQSLFARQPSVSWTRRPARPPLVSPLVVLIRTSPPLRIQSRDAVAHAGAAHGRARLEWSSHARTRTQEESKLAQAIHEQARDHAAESSSAKAKAKAHHPSR